MPVLSLNQAEITDAILNCEVSSSARQQAAGLVDGWIRRFFNEDAQFTINQVEREMVLELDYRTFLVGKVDLPEAQDNRGRTFFGEWKSGRKHEDWRVKWRMSPQALTYGILTRHGVYTTGEAAKSFGNLFLVRYAWKLKEPDYDQEWFTYEDKELNWWEQQVREIASEIRARRDMNTYPWMPNPNECFRYGKKYACPFFENACSKLNWTNNLGLRDRVSHLEYERNITSPARDLVVLDATRIGEYLGCHEKYRKTYEENLRGDDSEDLQVGSAFHAGLAAYYEQLRGE